MKFRAYETYVGSLISLILLVCAYACVPDSQVQHSLERIDAPNTELHPLWEGYDKDLPDLIRKRPEILPAFPLPSEKLEAGKADSNDDYRAAHPAWYAITIPPKDLSNTVSGMVEWEMMQSMLLAAPPGLYEDMYKNLAEMTWGAVHHAGVDVYIMHSGFGGQAEVVEQLNALSPPLTDAEAARIHWVLMDNESIWMVDYGPVPIKNAVGTVAFVDFRYYHPRIFDDAMPTRVGYDVFGVDTFRMPINFEGGNIQMDSMGTCYTTQGVLWDNSDRSEAEIRDLFEDYLGCSQLVIVAPLANEGTRHIDMFFKLVDDNTVILGEYQTWQDGLNKPLLDDNADLLESVVLADGSGLNVVRMPMPSNDNQNTWRTYINSTFITGPLGKVNEWPTYSVDPDLQAQAEAVWESTMPGWTHQKVLSDTIITWNGAMHCISRTVPGGNLAPWVPAGTCIAGSCSAASSFAYDGDCDTDVGCQGPEWLCNSNVCNCNGVTEENCCEDGAVITCVDGELFSYACTADQCGWDAPNQFYNCGFTGEGPASSPKACPWNSCTPSCAGQSCGDDGCGGSCGSCGVDEVCQAGSCVTDPGCGGLTWIGCCDGDVLNWCQDGAPLTQNCNPGMCGWDDQYGYICGASGPGPAEYPWQCDSCSADCSGKTCGDDGCGGSCGSCPSGYSCTDFQCQCVPQCGVNECGPNGCGGSCGSCDVGDTCEAGSCVCAASCDGKQCGTDGCGGSCGTCEPGNNCISGLCVPDSGGCGNISTAGECQGDSLISCVDDSLNVEDCLHCCGWSNAAAMNVCLEPSECPCTPVCDGAQCGPNGCGGDCGQCQPGQACQNGLCVCEPNCSNRMCGDNGCGGSCGDCGLGSECVNGQCSCAPDCRFKECGNDGCGGSCGVCAEGTLCNLDGICEGDGPIDVNPGEVDSGAGCGCNRTSRTGFAWAWILLSILGVAFRQRFAGLLGRGA
ncbi:MAG: hypothetical protein CMH54_11175 [Myxococcales bacterium]|nr:hypothetical protein [Myxococcales bacterium]